jgi:hypothetical protein
MPIVRQPELSGGRPPESIIPEPDSQPSESVPPENGADLVQRETSERFLSKITIQNGTDRDAVVRVERDGTFVAEIYVRSQCDYRLDGLMPGSYTVKVRQGFGWHGSVCRFREGNELTKFPQPIVVEQKTVNQETHFSEFSLTLHGVANGNVKVTPITEEEFDRAGG